LASGPQYADNLMTLRRLAETPDVWPCDAPAPTRQAIEIAELFLWRFHEANLAPQTITATSEGGVALCFVKGDKYSDIECSNEGPVLGVTTNRRDRPTVWEIEQSDAEFVRACSRIKKFMDSRP
jgi:hypothetical protein